MVEICYSLTRQHIFLPTCDFLEIEVTKLLVVNFKTTSAEKMSFLELMSNSPLLKSPVTIAREYFSSRLSDACKTSNISRQSVAFNVDAYCTGLLSLKEWGFYTLLLKSFLIYYRKIYCYSMRSLSFMVLQFMVLQVVGIN